MQRRRSLSPGGNVPSGSAVRPITLRPDQAPGGNTMTLEPSLLNMSVGDEEIRGRTGRNQSN
jgi:hypothetical protein